MNEILGRKTIFSNGKFLENFGKCDALGPSKSVNENMYKFSARLLENSLRNMFQELKFSWVAI